MTMSANPIKNVASTVYPDIRTPSFRTLLGKFKKFQVGNENHWNFAGDTSDIHINASVTDPFGQVLNSVDFSSLTPYRLDYSNAALFPEWYFHFLSKLCGRSKYFRLYIGKGKSEIRDAMIGTAEQKEIMLMCIESLFSEAFLSCIDESVRDIIEPDRYTREVVETKVAPLLAECANNAIVYRRKGELEIKATLGNPIPLVSFLVAFDYPEISIWDTVFELMIRTCPTARDVTCLEKMASVHFSESAPLTIAKIRNFVNEAKREGLFVQKTVNKAQLRKLKKCDSKDSSSHSFKRRKVYGNN